MRNKTKSVLYYPSRNEAGYTCDELVKMFTAAIKRMSPKEKAQLRVELRKTFDTPPQPEPDLWMN